MSQALLIIDMQRALCQGQWAAHGIASVMDKINSLSRQARAARVPVVLVQHEEAGGPLELQADGWALADGLETAPDDLRVRKTTPNSFHQTELLELLKARGVSRLVVCGLQTEFCVDTTVRQALPLGFAVCLAADAHSTTDDVLPAPQVIAHHNRTLGHLGSFGPRIEVKPAAAIVFGD